MAFHHIEVIFVKFRQFLSADPQKGSQIHYSALLHLLHDNLLHDLLEKQRQQFPMEDWKCELSMFCLFREASSHCK